MKINTHTHTEMLNESASDLNDYLVKHNEVSSSAANPTYQLIQIQVEANKIVKLSKLMIKFWKDYD